MAELNSIIRACTIAMICIAPVSSAQRVVLPTRIGWKEDFGASKFAKSIYELSLKGDLDIRATPPVIHQEYNEYYHHPNHLHQGYFSYGYGYNRWAPYSDYYQYPYGVDGRLRNGVQPGSRLTAPAPSLPPVSSQSALSSERPTVLSQARLSFSAGDEDEAIRGYRTHIAENPDDFEAAAELAAALIAAGRLDDGVAMIRLAYGSDPALAGRPISQRLSLGSREWRSMVIRAVRHAHKRNSASAWLAVSVLMQAEGRDRIGLQMLERAEQRGLDRALVSPLAAAMR